MSARPVFRIVETTSLPDYPLMGMDRLDSHWFLVWHARRWLSSGMNLKGSDQARIAYLNLIWISLDHEPKGTLPNDQDLLARLVHIQPETFRHLCALPYGPLHNWVACRCDDEVRLMHPVVVETLRAALARKEDNRARTEASSAARRLQRLRADMAQIDVALVANDAAIRWVDHWLEEDKAKGGHRKRTAAVLRRALTAWIETTRKGRAF